MPGSGRPDLSRRRLFSGVVASLAAPAVAAAQPARPARESGPILDPGGPDARVYGLGDNYPVPGYWRAVWEGNPWRPEYRVGAFSHLDAIFKTRRVRRAGSPRAFRRGTEEFRYSFRGQPSSLSDYVRRNPVTGLLVTRDDVILFEHYQYARTDADRMLSQSMVKSIVGLLVGLAVSDGAIRSVDDTVETYVPGFKGSEYGRTPIRALLHMSSGVDFGEERDGGRDLDRLWKDMVIGGWLYGRGTIGSMTQFNHRIAPPDTRFSYASIEPDVLGQVVSHAVGKSLSDYLSERVWQPIGAESDATWMLDAQGFELPHFGFSAVLRDYARLGRLLAHDGSWDGRTIIPSAWMMDATTVRPSESYLLPGHATRDFGYGYLLWLLPGNSRQFAMLGACGQRICIDPGSKLVMVHTALEEGPEIWRPWSTLVRELGNAP